MGKSVDYNRLSIEMLEAAATAEAADFQFTDGWDQDRGSIEGFAFDEKVVLEVDDAVSATEQPDGSGLLHVSISDIGSFAHLFPAISVHAQRVRKTHYQADGRERQMLHRVLSRDRFSLLHDTDRPAVTFHIPFDGEGVVGRLSRDLITRDVIRTTALSPDEVELALLGSEEEFPTPIHQLGRIARKLCIARYGRMDAGRLNLEDIEGRTSGRTLSPSRLIVEESMLAASLAVGGFFNEEQLPGIYPRFDAPARLTEWFRVGGRGQIKLRDFAIASYGTRPGRHLDLQPNGEPYVGIPVTSPLRDFIHYANHANLAAYLDNHELPYNELMLGYICNSYNLQESRYSGSKAKTYQGISAFADKLRNGSAEPHEYAGVIFGSVDVPARDITLTRQRAFDILTRRGSTAVAVIREAVIRGLVSFDETDHQNVITTSDGESVRDRYLLKQGASNTEIALDIIGQRARLDVGLEQIRLYANAESEYEANRAALRDLVRIVRGRVEESTVEAGDGTSVTHTIAFRTANTTFTSSVTALSSRSAMLQAVKAFMAEHASSVVEHNPRVEARTIRAEISKSGRHPKSLLLGYASKRGLEFSFDPPEEITEPGQPPQFSCEVRIADDSGVLNSAKRTGPNKEDAKLLAANDLAKALGLVQQSRTSRSPR